MKKLILLSVALFVTVQLFAQTSKQYDLSELSPKDKVTNIIKFLYDTTSDKLKGFDRIDVGKYEQLGSGENGTGRVSFVQRITLYVDSKKTKTVTDECLYFWQSEAHRYKGAYLTALENNGFTYLKTDNEGSHYYLYTEEYRNLSEDQRWRKLNELAYYGLLDEHLNTGKVYTAYVQIEEWDTDDGKTMIKAVYHNIP